ncbi:MAG: hypothetical protein JRH20_29520 [Deltaproteobacteria bacterium]|nr:hypothetical protein [Deltaproteobacteria bacterium]
MAKHTLILLVLVVAWPGFALAKAKPKVSKAKPKVSKAKTKVSKAKTKVSKAKTPKTKPEPAEPKGRPDLAAIPARASALFRITAEKNRKKGDKVLAKVLRQVKTATNWNVDPANKRQVSSAVSRIKAQRKTLSEAKALYLKAAKHERLVHTLAIKAARIRGLLDDKDTDVARHIAALEALKKDPQQRKDMARVQAVDLLAQALSNFISGKLAPAIILVDRSIKTHDSIALAYVLKGSMHYLTQDRIRAVEAWKEALRLNPKNKEIRRALEQMGSILSAPKGGPKKLRRKKATHKKTRKKRSRKSPKKTAHNGAK